MNKIAINVFMYKSLFQFELLPESRLLGGELLAQIL